MYIWPNGHFPENLFSRMDTCQNVHFAEWTFPRKPIFQNKITLPPNSLLRKYILRKNNKNVHQLNELNEVY